MCDCFMFYSDCLYNGGRCQNSSGNQDIGTSGKLELLKWKMSGMYTCLSNEKKFKDYSYSTYIIPRIYITAHCIFIVYVGDFFNNNTGLRT